MNRYLKRIIIGALIVPSLGLLYILSVIYFYDPLQLFSEKYPGYYSVDTRLAAKRVIQNYDFDSVIIGTSMADRSDPKELKDGKYINISWLNSLVSEREYQLKYLLKHKSIKNVVMSLDGFWETSGHEQEYLKLYIQGYNIIPFYFYFKGLVPYKCFAKFSKSDECIGSNKIDYYDMRYDYKYNEKYVFNEKDFENILDDNKNKGYVSYSKEYLQKSIIDIVKGNPNVTFHMFIPPYSTLWFKQVDLQNEVKILKEIISELNPYKNVKIYIFYNEDFVDNLNNYFKDIHHYEPWINSRINKAINEGTNIITKENMDEYFDKFTKKVENYDIKAYEEALKFDIRE